MRTRNRSLYLGILIALACTVTGCGEKVQDAPKAGTDIYVPAFTWRIRTGEQINAEYARAGAVLPGEAYRVEAYIGRVNGEGAITTKPPVFVDDEVACSLGHEVMHSALGDYHRPKGAK